MLTCKAAMKGVIALNQQWLWHLGQQVFQDCCHFVNSVRTRIKNGTQFGDTFFFCKAHQLLLLLDFSIPTKDSFLHKTWNKVGTYNSSYKGKGLQTYLKVLICSL